MLPVQLFESVIFRKVASPFLGTIPDLEKGSGEPLAQIFERIPRIVDKIE